MNKILALLSGLLLTASAAAQEPAAVLDITRPPTFGELTKTGLKFPLPQFFGERFEPSNGPARNGRGLDMTVKPAELALMKGGTKTGIQSWEALSCNFAEKDLTPPGEYYPPVMPLSDATKVSGIGLSARSEDIPALLARAAEVLKVAGTPDPKFDTWVATEMWKNSPQFSIKQDERLPRVTIRVWVQTERREQPEAGFSLALDWTEAPPASPSPRPVRVR